MLVSLANILIDSYHNLINNKNALTEEIGELKQERDDLVIIVLDLVTEKRREKRKSSWKSA